MAENRMIVGLGNPGTEYAGTRHNVGFEVVDLLAETLAVKVNKSKFGAMFGQGEYRGQRVLLLKPWNYMNRSGQATATASGFYKLAPSDVLIVLDDMWVEPGRIRIRAKGSAGGHNGLADVIEKLGTEDVSRLRVGIGQSGKVDSVDYVLGKPSQADRELIAQAQIMARDAAFCWLEEGVYAAMTKFNGNSD